MDGSIKSNIPKGLFLLSPLYQKEDNTQYSVGSQSVAWDPEVGAKTFSGDLQSPSYFHNTAIFCLLHSHFLMSGVF